MTKFYVYYFEVLKKVLEYLKYWKVFQVLDTWSTLPNSGSVLQIKFVAFTNKFRASSTLRTISRTVLRRNQSFSSFLRFAKKKTVAHTNAISRIVKANARSFNATTVNPGFPFLSNQTPVSWKLARHPS